ncbi:MAG TPA: metal ABC transporter substrate-binding protein [Polyangiaceae bacterium]|nr:metal ABC transporter substrate-binding protein [Polyangiaceae bacterium]
MVHRLLCFVSLFMLFLLSALPAGAALSVVTTTPDLAAVAAAVGGARVKVQALASPAQDPHAVDARPNLVLTLSRADLLIAVGADLEVGWLPTLQLGSRNGNVQLGSKGFLDCSTLVDLLERPTGPVDRSMGDVHRAGNPHYMLDPRAAERVAVGIGKRLSELDPAGRQLYWDNTNDFVTRLRDARKRWEHKLTALRGREVVAFHRSLLYLTSFAGLVILDYVEPKPGIPPNPRHVASLIEHARQHRVRMVVQEQWYPTKTSELIAQRIGARFVKLPGSTNFPAGQSYVAFMDAIVNQLLGA